MGFNSVAVILNDCVHKIEEDHLFGERAAKAVQGFGWRSVDRYAAWAPGIEVVSQAHADHPQIVAVMHNTGWGLGDADCPEAAIRHAIWLLEQRGYRVTKRKPEKEPR